MLTAGDKEWIGGAIEGTVSRVVEASEKRIKKELGDRIDEVEVNLHKRIDDVETNLNKRIDDVESNLETKIDRVERKLDAVTDNLAEKLDDHEKRVDKLEVAIAASI